MSELSQIMDELSLGPTEFRRRLELERDVKIEARTLRRYLAPPGASSHRETPDWLLDAAREMVGRPTGAEWCVGFDDRGRRIVVHLAAPRFAVTMSGRDVVAAVDWWDGQPRQKAEWEDAARRASIRFYHRARNGD